MADRTKPPPREDYSAIGERLRDMRHARLMPMDLLASRACVSKSFISQIENGRTQPSLTVAGRLCEVLGISLNWLCHGRDFRV